MYTIKQTETFSKWLRRLKDLRGKARIAARISMMEAGHLGDTKSVGGGVSELRVHFGPGYRVYYTVRKQIVMVLLVGGDKGTQARDIEQAKKMAKEIPDD